MYPTTVKYWSILLIKFKKKITKLSSFIKWKNSLVNETENFSCTFIYLNTKIESFLKIKEKLLKK